MRAGRSYTQLLLSAFHDTYSKFWQNLLNEKVFWKPSNSGQLSWTALILCSYVVLHLCNFTSAKSNRCKIPPVEWNGNLTPDSRAAPCYPEILIQFPCSDQAACPFPDFRDLLLQFGGRSYTGALSIVTNSCWFFRIYHMSSSVPLLLHTLFPAVIQDECHPV